MKKGVLKIFTKFTGKHLRQSLFFNKVAGLKCSASLQLYLKKRLWRSCFPVNFAKLLRTPFLQNTSGWLLLIMLSLVIPTSSLILTILVWKNLCFTKFSTKIHWNTRLAASEVFICWHSQLSSFNSIIVQLSEKRDSSNRQ